MEKKATQIATICECIDHCFAFVLWCEDFARFVDPEDMMGGLDRAFDVVSNATRLHSFLALRKIDDFLGGVKPKPTDLTGNDFGIDASSIIGKPGETFLSEVERVSVNKGVAHLTDQLSLDPDSEVELHAILERSIPMLLRLLAALRKLDSKKEASQWLDATQALIDRAVQIFERREHELAELHRQSALPASATNI